MLTDRQERFCKEYIIDWVLSRVMRKIGLQTPAE